MNKIISKLICLTIFCLGCSCSNHRLLDKMEHIKEIGNQEPDKALVMLDSLELEIREESEYVKRKYDLLRIRLNDKADHIHSSDISIKQLIDYFSRKGSVSEKQEAYYYAGSIYRDLQDTPSALNNFFTSLDYTDNEEECDSIMVRNTYSNICYLYSRVQNYEDALRAASKELEISQKIKGNLVNPYMHLGASYLALDSVKQAEAAFDSAYSKIIQSGDVASQEGFILHLLNNYSELGKTAKAHMCLKYITTNPLKDFSPFPCLAFAQYYEAIGKGDSAIIYCKRILDEKPDIYSIYDAAKMLYRLYYHTGDIKNTMTYANLYMQYSDSLDFGKRQELAATINNEFQYHLDQKKEQSLKDEKTKYMDAFIIVCFIMLLLILGGYVFYYKRKNKHLTEILKLSDELKRTSDKVKAKELQLAEKTEQNKAVISLLHQSILEENAEDVIHDIKQSSFGKKDLTPADWKKIYQAVDQLYPTFKDQLLKELDTFTDQQMQVCYLIRIGLSNPQIQKITNLSRTTIWRWMKKYEWIQREDDPALNT